MFIKKSVSQAFSRIFPLSLLSVIAIASVAIPQKSSSSEAYGEPPSEDCAFPGLELPEDFVVYNAVTYTGQPLSRQIDRSGNEATQIDVVVNSPSQPVVLMLGASEPTVWDVRWTEGTEIVGVLASGYYHQAVAGLPEEIPLLTSTYNNKGECGYFYDGAGSNQRLELLSRKLFGQTIEDKYSGYRVLSPITFGEPIEGNPQLLNSDDNPVESFFNKRLK